MSHEGTSNGIIIVTIGLPGAGKTTLCKALKDALTKKESIICRHVCYDDILKDRDAWSQADYSWKSDRRVLYDDIASWLHESLEYARQHYSSSKSWCLIIDDNMYYRSMRYPYYQLARKYQMGYAQIYVRCSFDDAIKRNQTRPTADRIPIRIVNRMKERLQEPLPDEFPWEKYTILVDSVDGALALERILEEVWIACKDPAPPLPADCPEEKERQRQITKESQVHQADLALRRIVGEFYKERSDAGLGMPKKFKDLLHGIKERLFSDMKSGRLDLTEIDDQDLKVLFNDCLAERVGQQ